MQCRMLIFIIGIVLLVIGCSSEQPWIGTYGLEITPENKDAYEMFQEMEMVWPEITLKEDGTFLLLKTEGNVKITGTYAVKDARITLKALTYGGASPEGKVAESHTADFVDNYQVLMMEGPGKERWIRKEVNEAASK